MGHPEQPPSPRLPPGGGPGVSCPHCGGRDVISGLKVNQNAEVSRIGLAYKTARIFVMTEQLQADLCRACGTVVRFFVKEPQRNWIQTDPEGK